uniref:Uncharacterized protein n=1 Tax=Strombidium rassoulzadegani TaxID=1082188 RepID=A0A7S3CTW0_9SPIT|mmetsp:Transcript_8885/g.15080  ORF Transcript_8885/g.15080 Transcript_8885/m.15080 type:complete len:274 (+) Transcript_8885:464-1285(+)
MSIAMSKDVSQIVYYLVIYGLMTSSSQPTVEASPFKVEEVGYSEVQQKFVGLIKQLNQARIPGKDVLIDEYLRQKQEERQLTVEDAFFSKFAASQAEGKRGGPRVEDYDFKYPSWPYIYTVNAFHIFVESVFEFSRGLRMVSDTRLEMCEQPISQYLESNQAAYEYLELGVLTDDGEIITEGAFRLADTLQWWLPIYISCELSSRYLYQSLSVLEDKFNNLWKLPLNLVENLFFVLSDSTVFLSDYFYKDYFSLSFWIGDLLYQIVIDEPEWA